MAVNVELEAGGTILTNAMIFPTPRLTTLAEGQFKEYDKACNFEGLNTCKINALLLKSQRHFGRSSNAHYC